MSKDFDREYQRKYHRRLDDDFPFFSKWCLKIKTKNGTIEPFTVNRAQEYLHAQVEKQRMATGRVRVLVLKGRQQGVSTYIGGRFYWRTTRKPGISTFILSHEASTTEKLFQMVSRFQNNCPAAVRLVPDVANQRRLVFNTGSEYFVGTAGNEDVGRGGTLQNLHASEAAFYENGQGFTTGILQSVPDAEGTEVFIESTANGMESVFYPMAMNALQGKGDFILVFIPWFWQQEYRRKAPENFTPDANELDLIKLYGLDYDQLYWRRLKIIELKDVALFYREYPCSVEEAFTVSGESLIPAIEVMKARKSDIVDNYSPLVIGVDPNDAGGPVGIVWRRGRQILRTQIIEGRKPMELAGYLATVIDNDGPIKMFLDSGNGYGVLDRLHQLGYNEIVVGIGAGEGAIEEELYLNKRAEMGCALADWFMNGPVRIPNEDLFQKHLCCVPKRIKTVGEKIKLEAKEKIIRDTLIDPHLFDAAALTFAYPVRTEVWGARQAVRKPLTRAQSSLKTTRRRQGYERGDTDTGDVATATVAL